MLSIPGIIAEKWFPVEERLLSTGIAMFSNTIGYSFGYMIAALVVENDPNQISSLLLYSSIYMTVSFVLCLIFFRNEPKNKPNITSQTSKLSISKSLITIYTKPKNIINIVSLSVQLGICWTFTTMINNILDEWQFSVL
jgi:FLVCR family feline leukemia virus subgroup C receptor-related protein